MSELTCFKAYDIRGQLGTELDEEIAYRIGRAFAEFLKPFFASMVKNRLILDTSSVVIGSRCSEL